MRPRPRVVTTTDSGPAPQMLLGGTRRDSRSDLSRHGVPDVAVSCVAGVGQAAVARAPDGAPMAVSRSRKGSMQICPVIWIARSSRSWVHQSLGEIAWLGRRRPWPLRRR